jgi:2-polyprenyl-3-methyl-5-hydroxy-6-metoxy-1,4-benzoquinol methylase
MVDLQVCPLCNHSTTGARQLHTFKSEVNGIRLQTTLVQCESCNHVFCDPQPTWEEVAPFYGQGTFYEVQNAANRFDFEAVEQLIASRYDDATKRFNHVLVHPGGRYLDVGSGGGLMVAAMQRLGMVAEGVEPRADAVAYCRAAGLKVHCGNLPDAQFPPDTFDCVSLYHVLEHVPDPIDLLIECHRVLKPGGELVVGVPNYQSLLCQLLGWGWQGIDQPRHLHQFTDETLRLAGEKAGFRVEKMTSESLCKFVEPELARWLRTKAFVPMTLTLKTRVAYPLASYLTRKGNATGRGDALVAHFRKQDAIRP